MSTLAVVSTVSGATSNRMTVLAGIATALAGIFSMAAGEYLSSKSQRELALARISDEREKVARHRPDVEAEVAFLFDRSTEDAGGWLLGFGRDSGGRERELTLGA